MNKSAEAFRTIGEVAEQLGVPKHVLRFWEGRFPQIRPMKRGGGRRYYRPEDMELLRGIRTLLHAEGYTIKGVQKILREQGVDQVKAAVRNAVVANPDQPRKRGRKRIEAGAAKMPPVVEKGLLPNIGVELAKERPKAERAPQPSGILAALRELETARAILLGKALPHSGALDAKKVRTDQL